ncbi:vimentin-type intermediate filament-associated coiled-coil protein-like [Pleurodeles waltl]|uniref:vimentin-type intermediate filament-associated coiled-coil protein-like n=1 Tax=Pleurodeles waltl TaxID=8319 RepID=UPI0037094D13
MLPCSLEFLLGLSWCLHWHSPVCGHLCAEKLKGAWHMALPSPVQIKEANAHLVAVHQRAAELEKRLAVAEETVKEQAESLIRKDELFHMAVREIAEDKDREIADLQEKLCRSEETVQNLLSEIRGKDEMVAYLRHRSQLLTDICRSRPLLDTLLLHMAEGERMETFPEPAITTASPEHSGLPETNGYDNSSFNSDEFSPSEEDTEGQDLGQTLFGTTV